MIGVGLVSSASVWGNGRGNVVVYDGFNRPDKATLDHADTGQPWTEDAGDFQISGNTLGCITAGVCSLNAARTTGTFRARVNLGSDGVTRNVGVIFRMSDANNFWVARPHRTTTPTSSVQLVKYVSGTPTTVFDTAITVNANTYYEIKAVVSGDNIKVYLDGAFVNEATDSFNNTATRVGFRFGSTGAVSSLFADDFYIEAL